MEIPVEKILLIKFLLLCLWPATVMAEDTHEFILANGMKVLVREDHRAPVVVSQVWYKVGSSYEHDGITGVSHVLEHMMFKGTEKHPPGEFSRIISANGGDENAFTSADYTAYFQTLEKSRLPISLELEAERMRNLALPVSEFQKEIEVVKEERRWRTDDIPQSFTNEVLRATAFQTSPYRQPVIGWMRDLENLTVTDLEYWYQQWYAPNNAVLVVVGDVDPEEVLALAKKYFEPLPAREIERTDHRAEVVQQGIKRVTVKRPAELPYMIMAYKTPTLKTATDMPDQIAEWEIYALEVMGGILDGGNSARFASNLVRGQEVATAINLNYGLTSRLDSLLTISGVPANKHTVDDLERAVRSEIEALKTTLINNNELERVKAQVIAGDVYERDSIFYQGMVLGIFESIGLPWHMADEYVDKVKAVTAEQVQQVTKKYLVDDRLTVAVLEPLPLDEPARPPAITGGSDHVR
jgi:zinc protease